jgi:outer membrane protein TolC
MKIVVVLFLPVLIIGCVSEKVVLKEYVKQDKAIDRPFYLGNVNGLDFITTYQSKLVSEGPQLRAGTEGLDPIIPVQDSRLPVLEATRASSGRTRINLNLEDAVLRAMANSPEISVVSFDPSIAKEDIVDAVSEFDVTVFGELGYDKNDFPSNDIFESGQSDSRLWEAGIKQKGVTGAEWRLAYAFTRSFDDSVTRRFRTSHEPAIVFELKQPLLRDAWQNINLAGVNVAKLNYRIALAGFHQEAEDVTTRVISLYWTLVQARRDVEIQQNLLDKTTETLRKVEDRKNIDATVGDIKQAEASVKSREAALLEAQKRLFDVQDGLVRLLADRQMNLIDDLEIIPTTAPGTGASDFDQSELLKVALENNPEVLGARLKIEVADINVRVARRQKMPRLDIVASAQLEGLDDSRGDAHEMIYDRDFSSYSLGLTFEYPLGNREKEAEFRRRKLERSRALSTLQNVSDRIATLVKNRIRSAEIAHKEIQIQKDAVDAARIYLQALEDIETIRTKLTPEFLLAKIQAQDSLANAQRAEIGAIVNFNISLTRLAQATGKVLDIGYIKQYGKL